MRLFLRGRGTVTCRDTLLSASIRPLRGELERERYGECVRQMLRLILPKTAFIVPGDIVTLEGKPYLCVQTRRLHSHMQADIRRCAG